MLLCRCKINEHSIQKCDAKNTPKKSKSDWFSPSSSFVYSFGNDGTATGHQMNEIQFIHIYFWSRDVGRMFDVDTIAPVFQQTNPNTENAKTSISLDFWRIANIYYYFSTMKFGTVFDTWTCTVIVARNRQPNNRNTNLSKSSSRNV